MALAARLAALRSCVGLSLSEPYISILSVRSAFSLGFLLGGFCHPERTYASPPLALAIDAPPLISDAKAPSIEINGSKADRRSLIWAMIASGIDCFPTAQRPNSYSTSNRIVRTALITLRYTAGRHEGRSSSSDWGAYRSWNCFWSVDLPVMRWVVLSDTTPQPTWLCLTQEENCSSRS